jgi:hypothetical protein
MTRPRKEFDANTTRHIVAEYNKGTGLVALAREQDTVVPTIRRVLVDAGVGIRGRGRPACV